MRRPQEPSLLYPKKTKNPNPSPIGNRFGFFLFGGRGWIRTTEAEKQQIYSLSPLATREHAQILFTSLPDDLFILADKSGFVNCFFAFFQLLFSIAKKRRSLAEILRFGCAVLLIIHGAGRLPLLSVPDVSGAHSPGEPQWPRRKADRAR